MRRLPLLRPLVQFECTLAEPWFYWFKKCPLTNQAELVISEPSELNQDALAPWTLHRDIDAHSS